MNRKLQILAGVPLLLGSQILVVVLYGTQAGSLPALMYNATAAQGQQGNLKNSSREVLVYASDLPSSALSEFEYWNDPASPGGRMVGTPNKGDDLDPPPENDPHVTFKAVVQRGVPYRCWIHMKVGAPKGKSQANVLWVQLSGAVDPANNEILAPGTGSYLTARGPMREGWTWVACDFTGPKPAKPLIHFRDGGEVTVRLQAGMEGVGFDQFLLSPARFLENPPSGLVVKK